MVNRAARSALLASLLAAGCDEGPPPNTGGTNEPAGACGHGLVVVNTDYQATNTSLVAIDGRVLSASFYSSSSPLPGDEGDTAALSADVVVPTMPPVGDRIVLVDRYFGVLTWVDRTTGKLDHLLRVGPNVALNLQDYVEISPHKAYVPNLDPHLDPALGSIEKGSNIVIVDPSEPAITGVIDLTPAMSGEDPALYPRPNRGVAVGKRAFVLLSAYDQFFKTSAVSRLVTIDTDTDAIVSTVKVGDMHGCTTIALSPDDKQLAVTCPGTFHVGAQLANPKADATTSGIALFSITGGELALTRQFHALDLGDAPIGFAIAFVDDTHLSYTTFGDFDIDGHPVRDDVFSILDVQSGSVTAVMHAPTPFSLGEVRCMPACGACFLAHAKSGGRALLRFPIDAGGLGQGTEITVDPEHGLPPRYLGQF